MRNHTKRGIDYYVTHKALGSFSSMAEDLNANRQQIANDCYKLKNYGWINFEVKKGQKKSIYTHQLKPTNQFAV